MLWQGAKHAVTQDTAPEAHASDLGKNGYLSECAACEEITMANFSSLSSTIAATFTAQLGSSFSTKMARDVLVILAGKILLFLAVGPKARSLPRSRIGEPRETRPSARTAS